MVLFRQYFYVLTFCSVGEICLALFSEDKNWYRGVCQEVKENKAKIFYCDFGNFEYVDVKNLKPISEDLLKGIYATKCYIDGIQSHLIRHAAFLLIL